MAIDRKLIDQYEGEGEKVSLAIRGLTLADDVLKANIGSFPTATKRVNALAV